MKHSHLFKAIYESISCPDDDSMFLSPEYKKWANEFGKWIIEEEKDTSFKHERFDHDDCIIFTYDQSTIWFTNDIDVCPWIKSVFQFYVHSGQMKDKPEIFRHEP